MIRAHLIISRWNSAAESALHDGGIDRRLPRTDDTYNDD